MDDNTCKEDIKKQAESGSEGQKKNCSSKSFITPKKLQMAAAEREKKEKSSMEEEKKHVALLAVVIIAALMRSSTQDSTQFLTNQISTGCPP